MTLSAAAAAAAGVAAHESDEWNSRTDRYLKAFSEQLKCVELSHLEAHQFYKYFNGITGGVGQLVSLATLFTNLTSLFGETPTDPASCAAGTACFGIKITGIVFLGVINAVIGIFLFYKPSALAEQHKSCAERFNELHLRIDWCLRRRRDMRGPFWPFVEKVLADFIQLNKEAPSIPYRHKDNNKRRADAVTVNIGAISGLSTTKKSVAPPPAVPRRHTSPSNDEAAVSHAAAAAATAAAASSSQLHATRRPSLNVPPVSSDDECAVAECELDEIEAENARRFEKIRRKSASARVLDSEAVASLEETLTMRRNELLSNTPPPMRWLKKQIGMTEEDTD